SRPASAQSSARPSASSSPRTPRASIPERNSSAPAGRRPLQPGRARRRRAPEPRSRARASTPGSENETDEAELPRPVPAIDQKQRQWLPLEQIGRPERSADPARTGAEPVERACRGVDAWSQKQREGRRTDQRQHERSAENHKLVGAIDLLLR